MKSKSTVLGIGDEWWVVLSDTLAVILKGNDVKGCEGE